MIIRRKHTGNFVVVPNDTANDEALSADALGVLVYLLAKPEDWVVRITDLRRRFRLSRNRAYAVIDELVEAKYVTRIQRKDHRTRRFAEVEYWVYDCPAAARASEDVAGSEEPLPQIREAENAEEKAASPISGIRLSGMRDSGNILKTDLTKPPSEEDSASREAGAKAPSVSKMIWTEGRELLRQDPSQPKESIIGKWLKRTPTDAGKEKLLAIIRSAREAGTAAPIAYVTKALDAECPPSPDPRCFDDGIWRRNQAAAIKTRAWAPSWGPAPGKKGCFMPARYQTPDLIRAIAEGRMRL